MSSEFTNKLSFFGSVNGGVENCAIEFAQLIYNTITSHPDAYDTLEEEYKFFITNLDDICIMKSFEEFYDEFQSKILIKNSNNMSINFMDIKTLKRPLPISFINELSKKYSQTYIDYKLEHDFPFSTKGIMKNGELIMLKKENRIN